MERVVSRSREVKVGKRDRSSDVAEQCRLHSLQKAMVIQWLCFTPPSTINDVMRVDTKLLFRALMHSNVLFREFALISMWRVPAMPIRAHTLLSLLADHLKHPSETLFSTEDHDLSDSLKEFEDWGPVSVFGCCYSFGWSVCMLWMGSILFFHRVDAIAPGISELLQGRVVCEELTNVGKIPS